MRRFALIALLALALPASAAPRLASRVNFGCVALRDAGDVLVMNEQHNTDTLAALVEAGRCTQIQTSGDFEPREIVVLERAARGDGTAFLRVRVNFKKETVEMRGRPESVDLWFPEGDIAGTYPPVPTRSFEESTR